ncbi:MAG: VOC family protein [Pseudomonadota bacterium]
MTEPLIASLDHLVLYVADPEATAAFYHRHFGMEIVRFGEGGTRLALGFGAQKINLHASSAPFRPHSDNPAAGAGDLCLLTEVPVAELRLRLEAEGVLVEEGPVPRTGATGPILSIYLRDPDGNLIEIANRA